MKYNNFLLNKDDKSKLNNQSNKNNVLINNMDLSISSYERGNDTFVQQDDFKIQNISPRKKLQKSIDIDNISKELNEKTEELIIIKKVYKN